MDIGASTLKLAEFSIKNAELTISSLGVRSVAVEPGSNENQHPLIVDAIRDIMAEQNIKPAPVVLSVSGQSAFLRPVKLPPVKREKIYQTVLYEAQQNVPFPINEVVWDYQLMGSSENELNVVLVAMKSDIVESMTDCIGELNLDLELVDVAPMALYNAVRYNYGDVDGCTLILDIGSRSTNLIFLEENRFFSRNLPVGTGSTITQQIMKEFDLPYSAAEELKLTHASVAFGGAYEDYSDKVLSKVSKTVRSAMTRLHVEVERSMNFYRTQQNGVLPKRILLAGGTSAIQRMDEFFKEKLKVEVDYLNPFRNIIIGEKISDDEIIKTAQIMGETVGVALRYVMPCPLEVNLLPAKVMADKEFDRKKPFFIMAGIGLVLTALCWLFYFSRTTALIDQRASLIRPRVQAISKVEKELTNLEVEKKSLLEDVDKFAGLISKRTEWAEIISEIHASLPDGMWILAFKPIVGVAEPVEPAAPTTRSRRGAPAARAVDVAAPTVYTRIEIRGMIFADKASDSSIRDFRDKLRASGYFKEGVEDTKITLAPMPGPDDYVREFIIEVSLENPLEMAK